MIHTIVRHCFHSPNQDLHSRKRPAWFSKKGAWHNLNKYTDFSKCQLHVLYDTALGDNTDEYYSEYKPGRLTKINEGTEAKSFLAMIDYAHSLNIADSDVVYFLEDDYLHRPGWETVLAEGADIADYVSLYDHLDKYLHYNDLRSKLLLSSSTHWRTTPSTCNTYAAKWAIIKQDIFVHRFFSEHSNGGISQDCQKFERLTGLGRSLITPIPGYSTHLDQLMSPLIDWQALN